jgi:hypothetical protein
MMAPQVGSRHAFTQGVRDEDGRLFLTEREPFGFQPQPDTRTHVAAQGDGIEDPAHRGEFVAVRRE